MNPFELSGPEFLLFYFILSATVIVGLVLVRRAAESGPAPRVDLAEPYLVAYLRGGRNEALRVALITLIDRGLLFVNETQIKRADNANPASVRRALEKAIIEKFATPDDASSVYTDPKLRPACDEYEKTLKRNLLMPDESVTRARLLRFVLAMIILGGVGSIKVFIALERGRTNVWFLIILMVVAIALAAKLSFPRLTARGEAMLKDVQTLYGGLKERATSIRPGGATTELMMLAAAFGVGSLAGDAFMYTRRLFPRAKKSVSGESCGSACGTYSSSSGGSSCGSSCGGGGCGGGCGGCGS